MHRRTPSQHSGPVFCCLGVRTYTTGRASHPPSGTRSRRLRLRKLSTKNGPFPAHKKRLSSARLSQPCVFALRNSNKPEKLGVQPRFSPSLKKPAPDFLYTGSEKRLLLISPLQKGRRNHGHLKGVSSRTGGVSLAKAD